MKLLKNKLILISICSSLLLADLSSNFDSSDENWEFLNDVKNYGWSMEVGNPAGSILGYDMVQGQVWYFKSPASWSGNWSSYNMLTYQINMLNESGEYFRESNDGDVKIVGVNGKSMKWNGAQIHTLNNWHTFEVPLTANSFDISQSEFNEIMQNVESLWIRGEFISGGDTEALDNVKIYSTGENVTSTVNDEDKLLLHYLFENNLLDSTINKNDATLKGSGISINYTNSALNSNYSINLNGSSEDIISIPCNVLNGIQNFAFSFWINTTDTGDRYIISIANENQDNYFLVGMQNNTINIFLNGQKNSFSTDEIATLNDGNWHHIVVARYYEFIRLYVDGEKIDEKTYTYNEVMDTLNGGCLIGQEQDSVLGGLDSGQSFIGSIADFRLYSGDVGLAFAQDLYNPDKNETLSTALCTSTDPEECFKQGIEYCKNNPSKCELEINTTLEYTQEDLNSAKDEFKLKKENIDNLSKGWNLIGTSSNIEDKTIFNSAKDVWTYENGIWSNNPNSIKSFSGIWVNK